MNSDDYDYDDDEQTSITDTQPISKILVEAHREMQELDDLCTQTTTQLRVMGLVPATVDGAGA